MEITNETTATRVAAAADIIPADAATAAESPEWRAAPPDGRQTADASNNQPEAQLAEILRSYGLAVTEKNVETLKLMLEHEIALTQNNVARMNQALKLADSTEKALFLFSSEIRLTQAGAAQLDLLSDGLFRVDEKLRELFASISEIADPALRDQLIKIFSSIDNAESFFLREGASVTVLPLTADQTIAPSVQAQGLTAPGEAEETKPPRQIPFITTEPVADNSFQPSIPSVPGASDRIVPNPIDALFQGQLNPAQPAGGELVAIPALTPTPEAPAISKLTPAEAAVNAQAPMAQIEPARQGIVPPNSEAAASAVFPAAINETPNTRDGAETALRLLVDVLTRMDVLQNNAGTRRQSEAPGRADLQKIGAGLAFRLRGSVPGDIERFVNSMREALQTARQTLAETRAETAGAGDSSRFARAAWQLTQHLDFISQLKNHLYVQLPLHVDGRETLAELHVFKDAKKDKKSQGGAKSALVALDTAYLGHFEAFVLKNGESIGCQFRLRDEAVERLVKNNLGKLEKSLRGCGLSLDSFSFLPNGEPYRLPSPPPAADGNRAAPAVKSKLGIDVKA